MSLFLRELLAVAMAGLALTITGCNGGSGDNLPAATPSIITPPLPLPGPYSVACSNVEQNFNLVAPGEVAKSYWVGAPSASGAPQYVTDLLADPANTLSVTVTAPNDSNLYGSFAGKPVTFALLVCYPTGADNPRADYPLPTGSVVPHMQTGTELPLFADPANRYPMIVFSHGLSGSPISSDYMSVLSVFASHGYVVVAPFHGDKRFLNLEVNDLSEATTILPRLKDLITLQSMRPFSMSAAIDLMLANPQWRDHIDATEIGGFGASLGGETLMLMAGAGLTTSIGLSWSQTTVDPRLKAAVGYVPYFGQPFLPAFGRDQHGLDGVKMPYLAISGTADKTAPIIETEQGLMRLGGTRELVALTGVTHGFDVASTNDIFTWTLTFFDAEVRNNPAARKQLSTMASVAGGGEDRVVIPYNGLSSF
jgi:predicted dienelactone hydrolase